MSPFDSAEINPRNFITTELVDDELRGELTTFNDLYLSLTEKHQAAQVRSAEFFKFIKTLNEYANEFINDLDDSDLNEKWGKFLDNLPAPYGVYLIGIEQEYEVELEVSGTVTTYKTVLVTAVSQDAANDLVVDDPDVYFDSGEVLNEAAQSEGWDNIEVGMA